MTRKTRNDLTLILNRINSYLELSEKQFVLSYGCGGVRLCKLANEHGGLSDISPRTTISEMYDILSTMEDTIETLGLKPTRK